MRFDPNQLSLGKVWVQFTGVLDPFRCCHIFSFVQFLYTYQYLNGSNTPVHWTQAVPTLFLFEIRKNYSCK